MRARDVVFVDGVRTPVGDVPRERAVQCTEVGARLACGLVGCNFETVDRREEAHVRSSDSRVWDGLAARRRIVLVLRLVAIELSARSKVLCASPRRTGQRLVTGGAPYTMQIDLRRCG
jgi:hypothetical protein